MRVFAGIRGRTPVIRALGDAKRAMLAQAATAAPLRFAEFAVYGR